MTTRGAFSVVACLLALPIAAVPLAAGAQEPAAPAADADAAFVADTRDYLSRLEGWGFAGVVLVARGEEPLIAEGFGLADRERGARWTPATVSTLGSITKQFTGAAILALAEDGKLRVTDTLADHFAGVPEDKRAITLHQLLTHSSGIVDLEGAGDWDPIGRDEFARRIFAQPLAFAPGTGYEYSNAGYSLLGAIVEKLSRTSWEAFVRERFFMPLGIYETGYVLPGFGEERLAQGYRGEETWGTVLGRPMAEDGPYWVLRANGGVHSTVYDVLRWSRALMEGRVLSAESRRLLWEPHVREGEGADTFYGYGWAVQDLPDGTRVVTHNGGNGIFFADLGLVPSAGVVVHLMTNVAAGNPYVNRLMQQIGFRLVAAQPYPEVPRVTAADPAALGALAGDWRLAGGGRFRATPAGDALLLEPLDRDAFAALLSMTEDPAAVELGRERAARLEGTLGPLLAGDATALHRLYGEGTDVTVERLANVWRERLAGFAERIGGLAGAEVLGSARRGDRDFVVARFRGERGTQDVAFVWDAAPGSSLLGISMAGIERALRVRAQEGGGWVAWDPQSGESLRVRVEGEGERARLVFGADPARVASRAGAASGS